LNLAVFLGFQYPLAQFRKIKSPQKGLFILTYLCDLN
jgi:hypothetical protein